MAVACCLVDDELQATAPLPPTVEGKDKEIVKLRGEVRASVPCACSQCTFAEASSCVLWNPMCCPSSPTWPILMRAGVVGLDGCCCAPRAGAQHAGGVQARARGEGRAGGAALAAADRLGECSHAGFSATPVRMP